MQKLDRIIALYQKGEMSLFEAAHALDMHPSELSGIMVEKSRENPILLMSRQRL